MTINNVNDPPVATNDTLTAFKDTTATFDVLANDNSGPDPTETLTSIRSRPSSARHGHRVSGKVQYCDQRLHWRRQFTYTTRRRRPHATATANITRPRFQPSKLSGFVYFDVNNNGVFDSGELPISGVTITLTGTPRPVRTQTSTRRLRQSKTAAISSKTLPWRLPD